VFHAVVVLFKNDFVLKITFYLVHRIGVEVSGKYKVVLDSDDREFGGHGRLDHSVHFFTSPEGFANRRNSMMVI